MTWGILFICNTSQNVRKLQSEYMSQRVAVDRMMDRLEVEEILQPSEEEIKESQYLDDLELLALCVEAEAGNQDLQTKRACVSVILNRVDDPDWPDSIRGVIEQKVEFSSYWNGRINQVWAPAESTYEAVRLELEHRSTSFLYFDEVWPVYGTRGQRIGGMYFNYK